VLAVVAMLAALLVAGTADAKTKRGTARGDTLNGTRLADRLDGRGGPDRVNGLAGNDRLGGDAGRDHVRGGAGDDLVRGGADDDLLVGASGKDRLEGGAGNDRLRGGTGTDRLDGGSGDDDLDAADGARDVVVCGPGLDRVVADDLDRVADDCEVPHRLVLSTAGSGRGSVREVGLGVLCPPLCVRELPWGTAVELQPEPDEGSLFAGWTGDCLSAGTPCRLELSEDRTATALFVLRQVPVRVEVTGPGAGAVSTSPSLIDCGASCSATLGWGATLTLTAVPAEGSDFAGWSGDCVGVDPVCVLSARDDVLASAAFEPEPPQLARLTVARPLAGGTVTSVPAGINCGPAASATDCEEAFPVGTAVVLTATPLSGQVMTGWTGVCQPEPTRTCRISMLADADAGAVFAPGRTLRVEVVDMPLGLLDAVVESQELPALIRCPGVCEADYRADAQVRLQVVPLGLRFRWSGNCVPLGGSSTTARTCEAVLSGSAVTTVRLTILP